MREVAGDVEAQVGGTCSISINPNGSYVAAVGTSYNVGRRIDHYECSNDVRLQCRYNHLDKIASVFLPKKVYGQTV